MTTKVVPGLLIATPDAEGVAREAANRMGKVIRESLQARGKIAIALSGGDSPRPAYAIVAKDPRIDWSKVDVYWVDERAVAPTSDRSNYRWAKESLLDPAKIPAEKIHRMPGEAKDLAQAAREYETLLKNKLPKTGAGIPQFDLTVLGIGDDGHTASIFPGEPTVDVLDKLVVAVPAKGSREARLTVTVPVIEATRYALIIAIGAKKQGPLEKVWATSGDPHQTPARIIRGIRGGITWVIDKAAGGLG